MYPIPFVHGCAVADSRGQIVYSQGDLDKVFPLMSVTKPLAAYTILLLVQQGKLSLDTPVDFLLASSAGAATSGAPSAAPSRPNGSARRITLRHLLSHSAGLGYESGIQCAPETKRIYSNLGIELAAEMAVQAANAQPTEFTQTGQLDYPDVLKQGDRRAQSDDATRGATGAHVGSTGGSSSGGGGIGGETFASLSQKLLFQPLGMKNTEISRSAAYSGVSNVRDLLKFAAELATPTRLRLDLYQRMTRPVFSKLRGTLPGYGPQNPCEFGLGVEIRGRKDPHWLPSSMSPESFGHFGMSGSFLWIVPRDSNHPLAGWRGVFLGEQDFGEWHVDNWPKLQTYMFECSKS